MKKLCYILLEYSSTTPTHHRHILDLLCALAKEVKLFLIIASGRPAKRWHRGCTGNPAVPGVAHIYKHKFSNPFLRAVELFIVLVWARLRCYKIFYTHYSYVGGIVSAIVANLSRGKSFYWHCGQPSLYFQKFRFNRNAIRDKLHELFIKLTLKCVDYLVTGTKTMAEYYSNAFRIQKHRIVILPNWIDLARFDASLFKKEKIKDEWRLPKSVRLVLWVNRLATDRGAHHIVKIAKEVISEVSDARFLIVGDGEYRQTLEAEIRQNHLEDVILLQGWVPNRDVAKYYAVSDVFILPSERAGFPRTLLEAMSMGIPFVTTDAGGVRDVLSEKQKRFLVEKGDMDTFCRYVSKLLKNGSLRREMAIEGLNNVMNYSLESVSKIFKAKILFNHS